MILSEARLARRPQVIGFRPTGQAEVQEGSIHFTEDGADRNTTVNAWLLHSNALVDGRDRAQGLSKQVSVDLKQIT